MNQKNKKPTTANLKKILKNPDKMTDFVRKNLLGNNQFIDLLTNFDNYFNELKKQDHIWKENLVENEELEKKYEELINKIDSIDKINPPNITPQEATFEMNKFSENNMFIYMELSKFIGKKEEDPIPGDIYILANLYRTVLELYKKNMKVWLPSFGQSLNVGKGTMKKLKKGKIEIGTFLELIKQFDKNFQTDYYPTFVKYIDSDLRNKIAHEQYYIGEILVNMPDGSQVSSIGFIGDDKKIYSAADLISKIKRAYIFLLLTIFKNGFGRYASLSSSQNDLEEIKKNPKLFEQVLKKQIGNMGSKYAK